MGKGEEKRSAKNGKRDGKKRALGKKLGSARDAIYAWT